MTDDDIRQAIGPLRYQDELDRLVPVVRRLLEQAAPSWQPMETWARQEYDSAAQAEDHATARDGYGSEMARAYFARKQAFAEVLANIDRIQRGMPLPAPPKETP